MSRIVKADEISEVVLSACFNPYGTHRQRAAAAITAWLAERAATDHIPDIRKMVPEQNNALLSAWSLITHAVEQASAQGFQAGAEAMREAAARAAEAERTDWTDLSYDVAYEHCADSIRALPLPETAA